MLLERILHRLLQEDWEEAAKRKRDAIFRQMMGLDPEEEPAPKPRPQPQIDPEIMKILPKLPSKNRARDDMRIEQLADDQWLVQVMIDGKWWCENTMANRDGVWAPTEEVGGWCRIHSTEEDARNEAKRFLASR